MGADVDREAKEILVSEQSLNANDELMVGLNKQNKHISPKYFYDELGSKLFNEITLCPEYYPTRTEANILRQHQTEISRFIGQNSLLIEPGAGNCEKVTYLLDAIKPTAYFPQDISGDFLEQTSKQLKDDYPWLVVHPLPGDFHDEIVIPAIYPNKKRVVFYPGSTIGNFEPIEARNFLARMRDIIGGDGGMIIGVDLQKAPAILNAAYNDEAGITAQFNLNILNHVNRLLDAEFCLEQFSHYAFYNEQQQRIEMHLESLEKQTVRCGNTAITLEEGERIQTENSYKYTIHGFKQLANSAGLTIKQSWLDDEQLFSVHYLEVIDL